VLPLQRPRAEVRRLGFQLLRPLRRERQTLMDTPHIPRTTGRCRRLCRALLIASSTLLITVGCNSPKIGSGLASAIGGGDLPDTQGSLLKDISKNRARSANGEVPQEVISQQGEDGRVAYRRTTEGNPDYFGRGSTHIIARAAPELAPSFADDGTCLRCHGRGHRFSEARSKRDYVVCSSCDGDGRR
jgi:hypothetical protein